MKRRYEVEIVWPEARGPYKFGISLVPFKRKIPHGPFKVPPSLRCPPPSLSPDPLGPPRKRGYPSIRRRVPIANEKSCSVAFNSMCRATRATISTRSINRVSCARGYQFPAAWWTNTFIPTSTRPLKGSSLARTLSAFLFSSRRVTRASPLTRGFAFQRSARRVEGNEPRERCISNLMPRSHGNNPAEAILRAPTRQPELPGPTFLPRKCPR